MNMRRTHLFVILALLCLMLIPGHMALAEGVNLLTNGGFEEVDDSGFPVGWYSDMYVWDDGVSILTGSTAEAHEGTGSARLRSLGENDARFVQTVPCQPDTVYKLSGWAHVEDVPEGSMGANLSVENAMSATNAVTGTSADGEWTYMELYGITGPDQTELNVMARLGFYSNTITGMAYFDDIALQEAEGIPEGANWGYFYIDNSGYSEPEPEPEVSGTPDHTALILIVAALFTAAALALLRLRSQNRLPSLLPSAQAETGVLGALLGVALVVRLVLGALVAGYPNDIACWQGWGSRLLSEGMGGFYESGWCDYPPLYMCVLGFISGVNRLIGAPYMSALSVLLFKLPAIICDLVSAILLYKWMRREKIEGGMAMWLAALYVLNPMTITDSAAWGQIDSVLALLIVLAVYLCVQGRWAAGIPVFAISALVKPQALMLAPVAAIVLVVEIVRASKERGNKLEKLLMQMGIGVGISLAAFALMTVLFKGGQPWHWLILKYTETLSSYSYATINAMNVYALLGLNWVETSAPIIGIPASVWGYAFMALSIAYSAWLYWKANDRRVMPLVCAVLLLTLFSLTVKMHERYAFPAVLLLLVGYVLQRDRRMLLTAIVVSLTQFVNMALVLQSEHMQSSQQVINSIVALLNLGVTAYTCVFAWDVCVRGRVKRFGSEVIVPEKGSGVISRMLDRPVSDADRQAEMEARITGRSSYRLGMKLVDYIVLGALTLCYGVLAFTNLGVMSAPETEWRSSMPGETVTIDLGEERTFDMTYYGGICDSSFTVQFSSDGENWTEPEWADYRQGKIFQWLWYRPCVESSDGTFVSLVNGYPENTARYVRLNFESVGFKMGEIAFLDENGECYPIAGITNEGYDLETRDDPARMIDEQHTVPAEPSYYNSMYFDEIYHARTAYEHLHGMNTYEWTHPPLGKVLMMVGIALFGMNPFGWRFMGALTGVLMVPAMYLLTKQLFKRRDLSIFTTVLLAFDCMHFTQTRIATIDSYGVFFIMLMYLFMIRYMQMSFFRDGLKKTLLPLGLSGLFMGIGIACKWIDLYAAVGLAILFFASVWMRYNEYMFARRRLANEKRMTDELKPYRVARDKFISYTVITLALCCVFFIAVPLAIYYLSYYWQLAPEGGLSVNRVVFLQKSMLDYHAGLSGDTHPFRADWYTWPLILKPMYYYSGRDFVAAGNYSIIWCLGNPIVWWTMLAGMLFTMVMAVKERLRDRDKLIVIVSFLAQYLPWVLVPRSMYIYHYFASIPFMVMSLCFAIRHFEALRPRLTKLIGCVVMVLAVAAFVIMYPVISGAECSAGLLSFINSMGPWHLY